MRLRIMLLYTVAAGAGLLNGTCGNKDNPATAGTAPVITAQPASQTITEGDSVAFVVTATGDPAPTCQWQMNGADISGATGAVYWIASATIASSGVYRVIVTNAAGSDTSTPAILSVNPSTPAAPSIVTQPQSQTVDSGSSVTFIVVATGNPAPAFQWRRNDTDIAGATLPVYTINPAAPEDDGLYSVAVSNSLDTVFSGGARLTVHPGREILPYDVSNDTIRIYHPERITVVGTYCNGVMLVTTFDTTLADTSCITYTLSGNTLTLTTTGPYFVYTVVLARVGAGSGLVGTWEAHDPLSNAEMQVVFTATTVSTDLSGTSSQPVPLCQADQYFMSSWPSDSINFNISAMRISCNGVRITGNITGEVVTMTWDNSGNKTYTSTDGTHAAYTWLTNPVLCPNDLYPDWYYPGFLAANPRQ
jgi:hypothetical protein